MEFSEFTVRLIIIFMPGLISLFVIEYLVTIREIKLHRVIMYSFLLGIISYLGYYSWIILTTIIGMAIDYRSLCAAIKVFELNSMDYVIINSLLNSKAVLDFQAFKEIFGASILSFLIGCGFAYTIKYKWLYWIAKRIKLSNKHGDIDVWSFVMNLPEIQRLVIIKDKDRNRIYYGWVAASSYVKDILEIFLENVTIYETQGNKITNKFYTRGLYLTRKSDTIEVQFPYLTKGEIEKDFKEKGHEG